MYTEGRVCSWGTFDHRNYDQTYPKKDKTNLRIDCGFLLVVISNEVLIVGIADSVCSSSDIPSRELNA